MMIKNVNLWLICVQEDLDFYYLIDNLEGRETFSSPAKVIELDWYNASRRYISSLLTRVLPSVMFAF